MGYKYQFVTLAGFHSLNAVHVRTGPRNTRTVGMTAYARLQEKEFALADSDGYSAIRHQAFVGTGYFDAVQKAVTGGHGHPGVGGSTESAQFSLVAQPAS